MAGDFAELLAEAFPGETFDSGRLEALKAAIRECVRADEEGEYEETEEGAEKSNMDMMDAPDLMGIMGE